MKTIKFVRRIKPKFEIGDRVRAIKGTEYYSIGSEGYITDIDLDGTHISISVKFDKGKYEIGSPSWGYKTDFIIIAKNDKYKI